jgi:hypothetical protein
VFRRFNIFVKSHHRAIFYLCWLIIHIIQASTTELFDDEAYYWVYSRFPAWGYFDHPSVIAILIKAGYALFHNELGVRLFSIFLTTASIYLVEELIECKDALLFYAICTSLAIAQIGGMMAVPDTPLMFFVALFFIQYRRFIASISLWNTLLLGGCIALMMYTKYHSVLVILFTALSNISLYKKYQSWLALVIGLILYTPHIYWQHLHGYPSIQFHLFERNSFGYEIGYSIEYIIGQILMAGPLMGWLLIMAATIYKPRSSTERALKFSFIGIYVFFLLSTLMGKAEANWTIPSFIGMIVLSHQYLLNRERWKKILYASVPFTLLLVLAARSIMMIDLPPAWWIFKDEFHGNKNLVSAVKLNAGGLPVVFLDSYQKPSKYWFYSGDTSMALNTPRYRRNNFNFWEIEDRFIGRPAYVIGKYDKDIFFETFQDLRLDKNGGRKIKNYFSFSRVIFNEMSSEKIDSNKISIRFKTITPPAYLNYFKLSPYDTSQVYLVIYNKKTVIGYRAANITVKNITEQIQSNIISIDMAGLAPGNYIGKFAISTCIPGHPSLNSAGIELAVK